MAAPKAGGRFIFNGVTDPDNPDAPPGPIGVDSNALFPGQEVTVREIVPANEPGAHDDSEDAAVVEWTMVGMVRTDDGWAQGEVPRAVSIGVSQFSDLFKGA